MAKNQHPVLLKCVPSFLIARPARGTPEISQARHGPLTIAGLFRTASGVGRSARACADALNALSLNPVHVDLSAMFGQVDMEAEHSLRRMPLDMMGTLMLHLNAPETTLALKALGLFRPRRWRVIGHWVWELERMPPEQTRVSRHLTEIWAPSTFVRNAIASSVSIPVKVVPYYLRVPSNLRPERARFSLKDDEIAVLSMADGRSSLTRKNLIGSIRVFLAAVGDRPNCRLILKTRNLGIHERAAEDVLAAVRHHKQMTLIDRPLSSRDTLSLIRSCDIFLSLHRAEGFGLTMAEAMALGKPVIATGWSGNMDFMCEDTAAIVPYRFVPVVDASDIYESASEARWAEPDERLATQILTGLLDNPERRRRLGACATAAIVKRLSAENYRIALGDEADPI